MQTTAGADPGIIKTEDGEALILPILCPKTGGKHLLIHVDGVKAFYRNKYKSDEVGHYINPDLTFAELWERMKDGEDAYQLISVNDSLVRERIFTELASRIYSSYNEVYSIWLNKGTKTA